MKRYKVKQALNADAPKEEIVVQGWVRTRRDAKGFSFLEINDGSCLKNLQVIAGSDIPTYSAIEKITTGAAISVLGDLLESPGKGQKWELQARALEVVGEADPEGYPLQKKRHSDEFLRSIAHLRPRTNKYGAINRIRSELSFGVHAYFHDRGFAYVHSPIITGSDCEGAGELFRVTSLDLEQQSKGSGFKPQEDFFGKCAYLTVSGQLSAEVMATALGDVYTFGPTFRAENSNTPKHAAEFWMIEPEIAFADLQADMDLAEDFIKWLVRYAREKCPEDLDLFARFVDKELEATLDNLEQNTFERIPYAEAVKLLQDSGKKFEFEPEFGNDLQTEHERYLTEQTFKKPVIVFDYPKEIKPFYMRLNDDGTTVAAMDVLVPRIGEIIGGSQREERLEYLEKRIRELGQDPEAYGWYLDLRRFGSVPHAGFGMGFERFLMMVTGVSNIRDILPFPRTPRHLEF
ncbi:MAG: asparagine--tRNA ligase [Desulfovibrionales bacterium]